MSNISCSIHQPEHLPYPGFWCKLLLSDVFVVFDNAQYQKNHYHNRNKIKRHTGGWQWLTVPVTVANHRSKIKDALVSDLFQPNKYLETIRHAYCKAHGYEAVMPIITEAAKRAMQHKCLLDFNTDLIDGISRYLGIHRTTVRASTLYAPESKDKTQRLIDICKAVGATTYIAGNGSSSYMDCDVFKSNNIAVRQVNYNPFAYPRQTEFIQGLSILDVLMNVVEPKNILIYLRLSITAKMLQDV